MSRIREPVEDPIRCGLDGSLDVYLDHGVTIRRRPHRLLHTR